MILIDHDRLELKEFEELVKAANNSETSEGQNSSSENGNSSSNPGTDSSNDTSISGTKLDSLTIGGRTIRTNNWYDNSIIVSDIIDFGNDIQIYYRINRVQQDPISAEAFFTKHNLIDTDVRNNPSKDLQEGLISFAGVVGVDLSQYGGDFYLVHNKDNKSLDLVGVTDNNDEQVIYSIDLSLNNDYVKAINENIDYYDYKEVRLNELKSINAIAQYDHNLKDNSAIPSVLELFEQAQKVGAINKDDTNVTIKQTREESSGKKTRTIASFGDAQVEVRMKKLSQLTPDLLSDFLESLKQTSQGESNKSNEASPLKEFILYNSDLASALRESKGSFFSHVMITNINGNKNVVFENVDNETQFINSLIKEIRDSLNSDIYNGLRVHSIANSFNEKEVSLSSVDMNYLENVNTTAIIPGNVVFDIQDANSTSTNLNDTGVVDFDSDVPFSEATIDPIKANYNARLSEAKEIVRSLFGDKYADMMFKGGIIPPSKNGNTVNAMVGPNGVMTMNMNKEGLVALDKVYHEAVHVAEMFMLDPEVRDNIFDQMAERMGDNFDWRNNKDSRSKIRERLAVDGERYHRNRKNVKYPGMSKGFSKLLKRFFDFIRDIARNLGLISTTIEDFYNDLFVSKKFRNTELNLHNRYIDGVAYSFSGAKKIRKHFNGNNNAVQVSSRVFRTLISENIFNTPGSSTNVNEHINLSDEIKNIYSKINKDDNRLYC